MKIYKKRPSGRFFLCRGLGERGFYRIDTKRKQQVTVNGLQTGGGRQEKPDTVPSFF